MPTKTPLLILVITSIVCSRTMLLSLNDPEGPNLLIVIVFALFLHFLSLAVYLPNLSIANSKKKLLLAVFIQVAIAVVLYFFLN